MRIELRALSDRFLRSGHVLARLVRFGLVGVGAGVVYAVVTALLVSGLAMSPIMASIAGYLAALPVSFLGHRGFSFRSAGLVRSEVPRFVVSQAINLAVTILAMRCVTNVLQVSYLWGVGATIVLAPLANFLLMHFWVFGRERTLTDPMAAQ